MIASCFSHYRLYVSSFSISIINRRCVVYVRIWWNFENEFPSHTLTLILITYENVKKHAAIFSTLYKYIGLLCFHNEDAVLINLKTNTYTFLRMCIWRASVLQQRHMQIQKHMCTNWKKRGNHCYNRCLIIKVNIIKFLVAIKLLFQ